METLFIYLIKSSGLIALFYSAYYLLLRKETFFNSNRWFLIAGLFTSVTLPFLVFTKIIWVQPSPAPVNWTAIPVQNTIKESTFEINWYWVLGIIYAIGIALFLVKFAFDFFSLTKVLKGKTIQQQADYKFIDVAENVSPFSYFDYIVYNSSLYSQSELENILEHEKVHSSQNHTVDVLISRFFCIFFWYNPFAWLYKKAILQNLEFIADSEATKNISDKKAYQITLLKITTHENCVVLTNHFYQSLIKKRIVMLNKNQSKKWNSWKYILIIPVLAAFMLYFQVKVVAQVKEDKSENTLSESYGVSNVIISKNSSDKEMEKDCETIKKYTNVDLKFFDIKRNSKNEITSISATFNDNNGSKGSHIIDSDKPIQPFEISIKKFRNGKKEIVFRDANNEDTLDNADVTYEIAVADAPEVPDAPEALEAPEFLEAPEAPEPPTSPSHPYENLRDAPTPPDFPEVPELPSHLNNKKAMAKYEKAMEIYEKKMKINEPKMKKFEAEMEQYNKEMESMEPEMKNYDEAMKVFEKKMEKFNKEMERFGEKMNKQNIEIEKRNRKMIKKIK